MRPWHRKTVLSANFCAVAFSMTISLAPPEDFGIRAELLDRSRPIESRLYLYVERELARSTDSASFFGVLLAALCLGGHGPQAAELREFLESRFSQSFYTRRGCDRLHSHRLCN